jgi:hypothetical protein
VGSTGSSNGDPLAFWTWEKWTMGQPDECAEQGVCKNVYFEKFTKYDVTTTKYKEVVLKDA